MGHTIELSDEQYEAMKDQLCQCGAVEVNGWADLVGHGLFIRTVTYHLVGKVVSVNGGVITLSEASWIADSGRFSTAIKKGSLNEVEPVGTAYVNVSSITDAFPWIHKLPKVQT